MIARTTFPELRLRDHVLDGLDDYLLRQQLGCARQAYRDRAATELDEIESQHLSPFFLAVHSLFRGLRQRDYRCEVEAGKANGSLVMLSLGLSRVDPLVFGLYFEPFICGKVPPLRSQSRWTRRRPKWRRMS